MTVVEELRIKSEIDSFVDEIRVKVNKEKKDKKRIEYIQQKTHERFLTKYNETALFHDIFKNGEYNCVSSSALFAYILKSLEIPFEVKEKPTHVYLIAYPETSFIVLESTTPTNAIFQFSEKQKRALIEYLLNSKLITESDLNTSNVNDLIYSRFVTDEKVGKLALCAFQYSNNAIRLLEIEQYKSAYKSICKAELIYPHKAVELLKSLIVTRITENSTFEDFEDISYLSEMAKLSPNYPNILFYFEKAITYQLINKKNVFLADSIYRIFTKNLRNNDLIKNAGIVYHYNLGRFHLLKSSNKQALNSIQKAYEIDNDNLIVQDILVGALISIDEFTDEDEELILKLEKQLEDYPFLKDNNEYLAFQLKIISIYILNEFEYDEYEIGLSQLHKVIELLNKIEDFSNFNEDMVAYVFGHAGAYFYRKKDYKKAMEILNLGQSYFPNDDQIKRKIEIVNTAVKKTRN